MTSQDSPASFGTIGTGGPVLAVASSSLSIVFEWAAILPLVIYLASNRLPHRLAGQTALTGHVPIALFPRLGVLGTIADFLQQGQEFIDRASSGNDLRRKVWDVNWGSIFPCANGAVAAILGAYALRNVPVQKVPEEVDHATGLDPSTVKGTTFRRYQKLHVLHFTETAKKASRASWLWGCLPMALEVVFLLALLGISVVCFLFGLYGTAAAVLLTLLLRISRQLIAIERPSGYLQNNERDLPGCMLVALSENASTWYLYVGSRGIIDTILNKTMVADIKSPLGIWHAYGLRSLEALQILIMTYVAAQKGWDGVALLCLVFVGCLVDITTYDDDRLARKWLKCEGVQIDATSLQFSGRTPMIGTIQTLGNQKCTAWMDCIVTSSLRRNVWLQKLASQEIDPALEKDLTPDDRKWISLNEKLTLAGQNSLPSGLRPRQPGKDDASTVV